MSARDISTSVVVAGSIIIVLVFLAVLVTLLTCCVYHKHGRRLRRRRRAEVTVSPVHNTNIAIVNHGCQFRVQMHPPPYTADRPPSYRSNWSPDPNIRSQIHARHDTLYNNVRINAVLTPEPPSYDQSFLHRCISIDSAQSIDEED